MKEIRQQVAVARRRLNLARLVSRVPRWVMAGLAVAVIAWLVPKLVSLPLVATDSGEWTWQVAWLAGCVGGALVLAMVHQYRRRTGELAAAVEIDQRFQLRERVSSAIGLDPADRGAPVAACLLEDAVQKVRRIDVRDGFSIQPGRGAAWMLMPVAALFVVWMLPRREPPVPAEQPDLNNTADVRAAIEDARKQVEEKKRQLEASGLTDLAAQMESLGRKLDELPAGNADLKKEALVRLNDLREELKRQQESLGNPEQMRRALGGLKEVRTGPMRELNKALRDGDFGEAREALRKLLEQVKKGELDAEKLEQAAKDLAALASELRRLNREQEEMKLQLQEKLREALAKGDLEEAARLQDQLEKLEQASRQLQKLQEMANRMQQASEAMQKAAQAAGKKSGPNQNRRPQEQNSGGQTGEKKNDGEKQSGENSGQQNSSGQKQEGEPGSDADAAEAGKAAAKALEDLMEQMEQMHLDQGAAEALRDLEDELQECKNCMNGGQCQNPGALPGDQPVWADWAQGEGPGGGKRQMAEGDSGTFESRVRGQLQRGQTVVTGDAGGDNAAGGSMNETRAAVEASMSRESDPLTEQQLERWQRQHAMQYFQRLRDGN